WGARAGAGGWGRCLLEGAPGEMGGALPGSRPRPGTGRRRRPTPDKRPWSRRCCLRLRETARRRTERRPCVMDGSNGIFIVLPIVALIILLILVGLPFVGDMASDGSRSGAGHSLGHKAQGQIPGHSAAEDVRGSDAIGPGRS